MASKGFKLLSDAVFTHTSAMKTGAAELTKTKIEDGAIDGAETLPIAQQYVAACHSLMALLQSYSQLLTRDAEELEKFLKAAKAQDAGKK